MKIICSVEVINRALPSLNMANGKALRSSLTIGKSVEKEVYLFHQTNKSQCGRKYKVKGNIRNVFVKFAGEGKATIRFEQPEHDLAIKCDPVQLKGFLSVLKSSIDGVISYNLSTIQPNNLPNKVLKPVKTKLKITSKEEYPVLEGFPRTLEHLLINNANQKFLDSRILRLRNLTSLNLENNNLTMLPEQLGSSLPNLSELLLANNCLGLGRDWRWIVNSKLQQKLGMLDLRFNQIVFVPDKLVKLVNLVNLKLDGNSLQSIPDSIGCLKKLRYLSASHNQIRCLPGSVQLLKLEHIDFSGNPFHRIINKELSPVDFQKVPSLVDIAALNVLEKRLPYSNETLPQTLIELLDTASFCLCGRPCLSASPVTYADYRLMEHCYAYACAVVVSGGCDYTVAVRYCSHQCYLKQLARQV